jgi:hypothetical protein
MMFLKFKRVKIFKDGVAVTVKDQGVEADGVDLMFRRAMASSLFDELFCSDSAKTAIDIKLTRCNSSACVHIMHVKVDLGHFRMTKCTT